MQEKLRRATNLDNKGIADYLFSRCQPIPECGCWIFTGATVKSGYGEFHYHGKPMYVHRFMFMFYRGSIPQSMVLDHLCRNRDCCNPDHLEIVTDRVNILRGTGFSAKNAAKTHCKNGHAFADAPLSPAMLKKGHRFCLICAREANRARWDGRKAEYYRKREIRRQKAREAKRELNNQ